MKAHPTWHGRGIQSDIIEDFYLIAHSVSNLTNEERDHLYNQRFTFPELAILLKKYGYSSANEISAKLIELYPIENQRLEKRIQGLEEQKFTNAADDAVNVTLGLLPKEECSDKILKYERSIQKSIFQNLFLLKKLFY